MDDPVHGDGTVSCNPLDVMEKTGIALRFEEDVRARRHGNYGIRVGGGV